MSELDKHALRDEVRDAYTKVAETSGGCGCSTGCCDSGPNAVGSERLGYSAESRRALIWDWVAATRKQLPH